MGEPMRFEKTLKELADSLREFNERIDELCLALHEDQPAKNSAAIVDKFEYASMDAQGWIGEALAFAVSAQRAAEHPMDMGLVHRAVSECQERFRKIEDVFSSSLLSWDLLRELTAFARERKGEWPSWALTVRQGIDQCRQPLQDSRNRLADSWQEIAERGGATSISFTATNIGSKLVARVSGQEESVP